MILACVLLINAAGAAPGKTASNCAPAAKIYVMSPDGSGRQGLTRSDLAADHSPAWSPDGTRIAFERSGAILVMSASGNAPKRVTTNTAPDSEPAWSPDGTRIAFTRGVWPQRDVAVTQLATRVEGALTTDPADDLEPAWSPDGTRIAFVSSRDGSFDIFVMNADGSAQTNLTRSPAVDDLAPAWSPDGSRIAFASGKTVDFDILVMNADGSAQRNLTAGPAYDTQPAWSPDGARIAFARNPDPRNPGLGIFVMNADGSGQSSLRGGYAEGPAWSPDGTRIAFSYDASVDTFTGGAKPCYVPRIVGLRLAAAQARIFRAACLMGRIHYAASTRARGRVVRQYPRPRAIRARGSCVYPIVSRGRR